MKRIICCTYIPIILDTPIITNTYSNTIGTSKYDRVNQPPNLILVTAAKRTTIPTRMKLSVLVNLINVVP